MSPVAGMLVMLNEGEPPDPCEGAPSVTACAMVEIGIDTCAGGQGWQYQGQATLSAGPPLPVGFEIYWELATNSAGDNWAYWGRTTAYTLNGADTLPGSDGTGLNTDFYAKCRISIVPTGESPPDNCDAGSNEPYASNQLHTKEKLCI